MYHLLFVDDEQSVLDSLSLTIPWDEYGIEEVHQALSGREALDLIGRQTVHLMIADIRMPGMNGLELIKQVRQLSAHTRCMLLTGYADFEYARQAIEQEAVHYFLKPVNIAQLIDAVRGTIDKMRAEWARISSYEQALTALKDHLPGLRGGLLYDLIRGVRYAPEALSRKLELLAVPFAPDDLVFMMLIRMEDDYAELDPNGRLLFEYAIENIAGETLGQHFQLWKCRNDYDYLAFLIRAAEAGAHAARPDGTAAAEAAVARLLEQRAVQMQNNILTYLKGSVSVFVSRPGRFPRDVLPLHRAAVSMLSQRLGESGGLFMTSSDPAAETSIQPMQQLYAPPLLMHALEAGRWEQARSKLQLVFEELRQSGSNTPEHVAEVYYHIHSCILYIAHCNGMKMSEVFGEEAGAGAGTGRQSFLSVQQLEEWTEQALSGLQSRKKRDLDHFRSDIVRQVDDFLALQVNLNVSVRSIADHVHLHPVYLSKLYKQETGLTLGEYLLRMRMDKAVYLLSHTNDKIYEICSRLGYQNVPHFIKLFKAKFGVTPLEYRNGAGRGGLPAQEGRDST